ncbi:hypothetical protein NLG97_g9590 [Lecanicillium saksenae]|uniref:Uncharacterized protein n=1 Tax=Lecanicillium saksenae TaxID=468837 RepID=A0ACC1QIB3_9HYPO|nr:hypothetical protein NLG97_g9590 [Lecanicillium saksenae]
MELTKCLACLAFALPMAYGAPTEAATSLHPHLLAAMKRDLGLNAQEAAIRIAQETQAHEVIEKARKTAGSSFAGAWLKSGVVHVGVTDHAMADRVTAAGATPVLVSNSLPKLQKAKSDLNQMLVGRPKGETTVLSAGSGIASYHIDLASNKLVISSLAGGRADAEKLAAQIGLSPGEYNVQTVQRMPSVLAAPKGGDPYFIDGRGRCSIGFAVATGFISAGHCGKPGSSATTGDGQPIGTFAQSIFPGNSDMSFIKSADGTQFPGCINGYGQGDIAIAGSQEAPVGASVCRSGSTTGVFCGTITAKDATANYPEGPVSGLTATNVCAEPGDSGGSWYSGSQAQGVTSGGGGDCKSGGETFFQPVNPILQNFGVTLVTNA